MKKLFSRLLISGWRRNVLIVALAYLVAIGGTSVAAAHSGSGADHRAGHTASSNQHAVKKSGAKKVVVKKHGVKKSGVAVKTAPVAAPAPAPAPALAPAPAPVPPITPPATVAVTVPAPPTPPVTPPAPSTGWPDASNTGVPAGTALTASPGLTITKAGTVISGLDINGDLVIRASNVTIKNSKVHGKIDNGDQNAYHNTLIQRVEVIGPYDGPSDNGVAAVGFTGFTCDGCNVRGWGKGFGMSADVTIKNSWVHDIVVFGDPANGGSHNEAILSLGGTNLTVLNNRLDAGDEPNVSASLALYSQWEAYNNVLVQGNLFDGGGYCLYAGLGGSYGASNTKFINNTFGTKYSPRCGWYGAAVAYDPGNGNQWVGNVMQSGGAVPTPSRG